jgi:lipopolysaccharide/colanic/teichoic acid biosynthesis glycosyltransferase
MAGAVLAIWLESGLRGPIIYRQIRVGRDWNLIQVMKFRSMQVDAEKEGVAQWAQKGDSRVTRTGSVIRKFRIDELPQLFNVLRGEMSFVGPRPERPEFVEQLAKTIPFYNERLRVKPGITGWAQVRYQYAATEQDSYNKLEYDLYYVKNFGIFLDFLILLYTAEVVLWRKGAV